MLIRDRDYRDCDMIHVGDFGVGFNGYDKEVENLKKLDEWLGERNLTLHVFRGNHDNPEYFDGSHIYNNLKLHPDYTVLNIDGKNILGVGGAISIDRVPRRRSNLLELRYNSHSERRHHWSSEKFNLDIEKLRKFRGIDVVVTHTTPDFCYPQNDGVNWPPIIRQFMGDDENLVNDLTLERRQLTEMYQILNENNMITHWYYGHFHDSEVSIVGYTEFRLLNINEMYVHDFRGDDYIDELNEKYGE
tara:strand:- start:218 stop:955 length:738 start_codon:yes stop_codon:yes gene_type:complete